MVTLIIGHRGAGKTAFLHGLRRAADDARIDLQFLDLDEQIEQRHGQSIAALLAHGEEEFRRLERETLSELIQAHAHAVIAVGAGFTGPLPTLPVHVIWLKRATDPQGRSFLNRPRLNPDVPPIEEYLERWAERESRFRQWADAELWIPEGYDGGLEPLILGTEKVELASELTVLPESFRNWSAFVSKHKHWGWRRLELRDDLLTPEQVATALSSWPSNRTLFSRRRHDRPWPDLASDVTVDWALELGPPPEGKPLNIVSVHQRGPTLTATLEELNRACAPAMVSKLAVEIHSFQELLEGHQWWRQNPARRAFLPRSSSGRWRWYRSLFGGRMPLHFLREGAGSGLDQPGLWQACLQPEFRDVFAAVLGDPVEHSRSPLEHRQFFAARSIPFVAISVSDREFHEAWPVLKSWGLKFAAVTSPLKELAYEQIDQPSGLTQLLRSANTLMIEESGEVRGDNTDAGALQILAEKWPVADVWLWGGGGIKTSVRRAWPNVREFSARIGADPDLKAEPDLLIWAAGRRPGVRWPPPGVRPRQILDLNYGADSPGLEWAVQHRLPYRSGLEMFKLQASAQQLIWKNFFSSSRGGDE